MGENYRKNTSEYSQWCDPKKKPDKSHTVYRPFSMRKVSATKELNRLNQQIIELEAQVESVRQWSESKIHSHIEIVREIRKALEQDDE